MTERSLVDLDIGSLTLKEAPGCLTLCFMEKDGSLTFRLPTTLKARLTEIAKADGRKVGGLVTLVLTTFVETHDDRPTARRKRNRPPAQRVQGDRVPRNQPANAPRRDRKTRRAR